MDKNPNPTPKMKGLSIEETKPLQVFQDREAKKARDKWKWLM